MVEITAYGPGEAPQDLFRFRYRVYVEEMGRPQKYARHDSKTIVDFLDDTATNIVASDGEEILGCVRINFLRDGSIGDYAPFYGMDGLDPDSASAASICTRLMVNRCKRRTMVTIGVVTAVYEFALKRGIATNYIDCNRHLVQFFSKFGYERLFQRDHEEYGDVTIMRLDLRNAARLAQIGSPFSPICDRVLGSSTSRLEPAPLAPA